MAKISENMIPDINADWGLDASNNLPYSGEAVQEFIKRTLKQKYGYFHYDDSNNRYLVFADEESKNLYISDPSANASLLLSSFDAPFNFSAKIEMISESYKAVLIGTTGNLLQFKFAVEDKSGNSTGENADCTITIVNQGVKKTINKIYTAQQGREGIIVELDNYLTEGTNNISINIKGVNSFAATTVSVVYQLVNLKFTDSLDISKVYNTDELLEISCVVEGAGTKVIDWFLDGEQLPYEITDEIPYITAYTVNKNISLNGLTPGVHSIQYRLRSQVGENQFYSQTLFRNFFVSGIDGTIIGIATELPVGVEPVKSNVLDRLYGMIQYVPYNLRYAIHNSKGSTTNTVQIFLNNELQLTTNIVNGVENNSSIMSGEFGNLPIKITVNGVNYEMTSDTAISTIGVSEIADAKLNLRAFGRDNGAIDRESWTYGDYSTTFNGLYWNAQSGWVDNTLIINAGASASINYAPFEKDPMSAGKTIEVEFATRNVIDNDGVILDLTNENGHGLLITASEARLVTSDNKVVSTKFKAEEQNRISFIINRRESGNNAGFVFIYVNGILSGAAEYDNTATIRSTKSIIFNGSSDVLLKQIVIYDKPLSSDEILNNYILYRDSISEMLSIYNRNNVVNENGQLSPDKLINTLPVMYFTGLDESRGIPYLETQTGKAATKIDTYFDIEYENAQDKERNFKMTNARVRIQGTSSSYYPRKNYRFYSNTENLDTVVYNWKGDVVEDRLYSFKDGAQPVDCWCLKTDYAESSGSHNTGIARLWNNVMKTTKIDNENKLMTNAQKAAIENNYPYDVRTTVDGFPIVVFYRNTYNSPWQFLGKFNFNNDKSTPSVFGFCDIPGFENSRMQCWEVLNNGHDLCNFLRFDDEYFDKNWEDAFEARYDEDNPLIDDLKEFCRWIYSTKGASDGVNVLDESLMEKFKTEKWNHLDVYKMAAYYIYIMRFAAVDQTVKNSMLTSEDGKHYYFINYDNDTILGVRNDGLLKHNPYIDRQSIDPEKINSDQPHAFAGHDNVLWNNLEMDDEFMEIVKVVDNALYEAGLSYDTVINMFENEQTLKWSERVCNIDAHYKYIAPSGRRIEALQGNRNSHRRWWVSERFNLYDAKFITGEFKTNVIEIKLGGAPRSFKFATIGPAKRQPYGAAILGRAEITDILDLNDTYSFSTPSDQTLQEGDPISIYGSSNIKKLDVSNSIPYMFEIHFDKHASGSTASSLEELIMSGNNIKINEESFTGTKELKKLKYLDIQGLQNLSTIDLSNSLNLKTLLAKNTGLTSAKLAPGCLIERLELPTSTAAVVLEDLPLLTHNNLVLDGDWANVRQIKISGCPNITNNFDLIWNWYDKTRNIEVRSVDIQGVNWEGVNIDQLIELGQNTNIILKGSIKLTRVDDKFKLLTLKELYGENIFNTDSDLHIYGPDAIYVFGPEDRIILEGNDYQFETIIFSDETGTLVYEVRNNSREGVVIDPNTGLFTTVENGLADSSLQIVTLFVSASNKRLLDTCDITIQKRIYPQTVSIDGPARLDKETDTYTYRWTSPTKNITGNYTVRWSLKGTSSEFISIKEFDNSKCVIVRNNIPETIATETITLEMYRNYDEALIASCDMTIRVVNPNIIMAMDTNPEVLTILMNHGLAKGEYLLKSDAEAITDSDIYVDATNSIFTGSKITHFEEFEYFTNLTKIPDFCFSGCDRLQTVKIPENVVTIGLNAFQNTALTTVYIPRYVQRVDQKAFSYCKQLTSIVVDNFNSTYCSYDGNLYMGANPETLYMIAPGLTEYVMPETTTSVYGDGSIAWSIGSLLRKIVLNEKIQGINGKWFMYGFSNLTEVTGVERSDIKYYNGCIYNSDYSKLIYWPSGKTYSEMDLKYSDSGECLVREFGERAFSQNKRFTNFTLPSSVTKLGDWVFYNTSMTSVIVHENVTEIGNYCFSWNSSLQTVDIKTTHLTGTNIFASCAKLANVSLANITSIPNSTFHTCSKLIVIDIPETVTSIGDSAFVNSGLVELEIPAGVKTIGLECFMGCVRLGDINCLPTTAPSLGKNSFGDSNSNYTGSLATFKEIHIPSNATGYDSGDWKSILQDKVGFTVYNDL